MLTVVLGKNNKIWYGEGKEKFTAGKTTNYSAAGIRKLILHKKKAVLEKRGSDQFVLIIKPSDQSSVGNKLPDREGTPLYIIHFHLAIIHCLHSLYQLSLPDD